jgi:plastocyanin
MTTSMLHQRRWAPAIAAALGILALLALGGGETAGASATKTVSIVSFAFKPGTVRVKRGARVAFANTSNTTHTATRGGVFDTKRIAPGKSVVVRFNRKGTFAYHCKIHPFMKGRVVVE